MKRLRLLDILSPKRSYHEKKTLASILLRVLDVLLLLLPRRSKVATDRSVRKILLMNPAYNGDLLISTSVLPIIRRTYPDAEIGFVVGSWARQVIENHPEVKYVHVLDVFRLNRRDVGLFHKIKQQWRTQVITERDVRELKYDLAIDLFTGFPPLSWFAWKCSIPNRVGYLNHGFGALLTHPVQLKVVSGKHETEYQADLVVAAGANPINERIHPELQMPSNSVQMEVARILGWSSLMDNSYIVIHPGTGEPLREWPLEKWISLATALSDAGYLLVFTGHGNRDAEKISSIVKVVPGAIDLCNKLRWDLLCAIFCRASLLIGVESMSGHLGAAWQVPTITLSTGMADPLRWRPANANGVALYKNKECVPCLSRSGCESMDCIRGVLVEDVVSAVFERLNAKS